MIDTPENTSLSSNSAPVGRPTKYLAAFCAQAKKLALLGATDDEVADFFEVNADTIYEWKKVYPKFSESLRAGKMKADANVAQKLYDRAIGAEWVEEQAIKVKKTRYVDGKKVEEYEEIITVPLKKSAPPETPAITMWLTNRKADFWRQKQDLNHGGQEDNPVEANLTVTFVKPA